MQYDILKGMGKRARTYRLSEETLRELQEIAQTLGVSETEAISRAIHHFYLSLKGEEEGYTSGAIIPFAEYQRAQDQLKQALYRIGELEGTLKAKEELIAELRERIKELRARPKKWWKLW